MKVSVYEPGHLDRDLHPESRITFKTDTGEIALYVQHGCLIVTRILPYAEPLAVIPSSTNVIKLVV